MPFAIRVFLADDQPTLRIGLRVLLEQDPDIVMVGEARDGNDALHQILEIQPDVAVLDCQLPGMDGVAVATELKAQGIATRVLAFSSYSDEQFVRGMLEAGAVGYLLKEEAPEQIVEAVRAAARGERWFSAQIMTVIATWAIKSVSALSSPLTEREREIVRQLVQGKSNKEIGQELGISAKAVEKHLTTVYYKWNVKGRAEATAFAVRNGWG